MNFVSLVYEDALVFSKTLKDCCIDVCITDPPYGVSITDWDKFFPSLEVWNELYRVLKPGSHLVVFSQPSMLNWVFNIFSRTDFEYRDQLIWQYQGTHTKGYRTDDGKFSSKIRNVYNSILIFRKQLRGSEKENWNIYRTNLLNIDKCREPYKGKHEAIVKKYRETGKKHYQSNSNTFNSLKPKGWVPNEKGAEPINLQYFGRTTTKEKTINGKIENNHKTVKPLELMKWLVSLFTCSNDQIIIDPFVGTGSTGCAAVLNSRNFIGCDINKDYIDISFSRIKYEDENLFINFEFLDRLPNHLIKEKFNE